MQLFDDQSIDSVIINKNKIPLLTPNENNSAESLLVGLLLRLIGELEGILVDIDDNSIADIDGNVIIYDSRSDNPLIDFEIWRQRIEDGFVVHNIAIKFRYPR